MDQLRLAQATPCDNQDYQQRLSRSPAPSAHSRPRTGVSSPKSGNIGAVKRPAPTLSVKKHGGFYRRLRKSKSSQGAYLTAQAESQWFQSLPPKVQQRHFSREEQARLASWRASLILDAADKALYKLARPSSDEDSTSPEYSGNLTRSCSMMAPGRRLVDSAVDMDNSMYDSFRWLEDDDLDLTLGEYDERSTEASTSIPTSATYPSGGILRRPSTFRRTLSFTSMHRARSSLPHNYLPATSQSNTSPAPIINFPSATRRRPYSRPKSGTPAVKHVSQSSVTSIDQPAQYYQDPEARLKLRVYLASPQKFDEAIEFGFPSLDFKENIYPARPSIEPRRTQEVGRTFLEEDDSPADTPAPLHEKSNLLEANDNTINNNPPFTKLQPQPQTASSPRNSSSSANRGAKKPTVIQAVPLGSSNMNREMTLKMTLTRADLRTRSDTSGRSSTGLSSMDDPLRLAELPVLDDSSHNIWDDPDETRGVVKKMWRRLRRRR
ncbi:hypothetical protein AJ80_06956 [Polytolypa hystricis UAMH7299]|uniref:Mucin n=1 Tax=Polytolypa hystricis (strain UAMH7299) TaxID=1447883 RepID=A0A2B7XT84_POLH7|nr:hypothetical protein AJ80_06956 [Polytolypa hystricis UAMH7299]